MSKLSGLFKEPTTKGLLKLTFGCSVIGATIGGMLEAHTQKQTKSKSGIDIAMGMIFGASLGTLGAVAWPYTPLFLITYPIYKGCEAYSQSGGKQ